MQYPARTGPTTNDQAVFTPSMTQGCIPDRHRVRLGPRVPLPLAPPDVLVFSVDMVQGAAPSQPRLFIAPKAGWSVSQPTHTAATFSVEMVQGARPEFDRVFKPFTSGQSVAPPDVLSFSVEMAQGSVPVAPRLFLGPRIAMPVSQTTQTSAAFSFEMVQGARPEFDRPIKPLSAGFNVSPPDVFSFSVEMAQGSTPSSPRLFTAPRIPLPVSQTTHTSAAFSPEMSQGQRPDAARLVRRFTPGSTVLPADVLLFSVDMVQGYGPASPRLSRGPRLNILPPPDVAGFSVEMAQGWHPDTPRLFKGPRPLGLQLSQTTHVSARFSQEMVVGSIDTSGKWLLRRSRYSPNAALYNFLQFVPDTARVILVAADDRLLLVAVDTRREALDDDRVFIVTGDDRGDVIPNDPRVLLVGPDTWSKMTRNHVFDASVFDGTVFDV